jgi:mitogen-activated protein kinase kinase
MDERNPDSVPAPPDELLSSDPETPGIDESSEASTPLDPPSANSDAMPGNPLASASILTGDSPRRVPSLRTVSDPQNTHMSTSSSVTGTLNNARRPVASAGSLPLDLMQKARALQQQRMGMGSRPSLSTQSSGSIPHASPMGGPGSPIGGMGRPMGGALPGGLPGNLKLPPGMARPVPPGFKSAPTIPNAGSAGRKAPSLSERRAMKLGALPGGSPSPGGTPKLSDLDGDSAQRPSINGEGRGSNLSDFKKYIDTEKGWITFDGAATITRTGVNFANGQTFSISLDEIEVLDELGKGNYGTVYKVRHAKAKVPRFGQGLSGFRKSKMAQSDEDSAINTSPKDASAAGTSARATTGVVMAMKEIRLELEESKFTTILKELLILHECRSPYIIDFYGAFFQEGAVYMCLEYMDGGSIDKLYAGGIPEPVLRKITFSTLMGLKTLKEDHNIIHRDVKPTNILANTDGQVKICDFGVSGNLVASIAKTNIGCQSYMAPERISGGGMSAVGAAGGTYSVQSDIWSLGLTVIECAMGRYPYPPEVSGTIFSQLSVRPT